MICKRSSFFHLHFTQHPTFFGNMVVKWIKVGENNDAACVCVCVCVCLQACKYAMRVCAPVLSSEQITNMFQKHLHEEKSLHYGEFLNDLVKYLVSCIITFIKVLLAQRHYSLLDASPLFPSLCILGNDHFT